MMRAWKEPQLDDLLSDPILDILLAHDRVSRDDLARVPRQWQRLDQAPAAPLFAVAKADPRDFAACPG